MLTFTAHDQTAYCLSQGDEWTRRWMPCEADFQYSHPQSETDLRVFIIHGEQTSSKDMTLYTSHSLSSLLPDES